MWLGASEAASADLRGAEAVAASVWAPRLPCGSEGCQQHGHDRAAALHGQEGALKGPMCGWRTVIARSTLVFARSLYRSAKQYADNKKS